MPVTCAVCSGDASTLAGVRMHEGSPQYLFACPSGHLTPAGFTDPPHAPVADSTGHPATTTSPPDGGVAGSSASTAGSP